MLWSPALMSQALLWWVRASLDKGTGCRWKFEPRADFQLSFSLSDNNPMELQVTELTVKVTF